MYLISPLPVRPLDDSGANLQLGQDVFAGNIRLAMLGYCSCSLTVLLYDFFFLFSRESPYKITSSLHTAIAIHNHNNNLHVPASLMTDCVSPMSPLLSNRERSTAPCSLVIIARWARMNREEVNDPRVKPPTCTSLPAAIMDTEISN